MTRTFLLAIELPDDADVNAEADFIADILSDDMTVTSVKPWSSPGTAPLSPEVTPLF
jgi:hypothetical protein